MSTYISKRNGQETSSRFNMTLDQMGIFGLTSLDDPAHCRTLRIPNTICICVFDCVSRIVSVAQYDNTTFCISDVREEKNKKGGD